MNIRTPYSKISGTDTHKYPPSRVKTAGYMPISKRIDLMIRAGLQMQMMPTCYQFQPDTKLVGEGPIVTVNNPGKNDLVDIKRREDAYIESHAAELAKIASERAKSAHEALRKQIIDDYIKTTTEALPGPSTPVPGSNPPTT